jgi:hypothetical protein
MSVWYLSIWFPLPLSIHLSRLFHILLGRAYAPTELFMILIHASKEITPSRFKLLSLLTFHYVWPFVLFKVLIKTCKIISYISTFFSNKINHNRIYHFYNKILNNMNCQTYPKKKMVTIIKIRRKYHVYSRETDILIETKVQNYHHYVIKLSLCVCYTLLLIHCDRKKAKIII